MKGPDGAPGPRRDDLDRALAAARTTATDGFTTLYRLLAGEIAAFVRARGVTDVDDLVNEVFLGAFRGLPRFTGDGRAFRAYTYRIARNKVFDQRQAAARSREELTADPGDHRLSAVAEGADVGAVRLLDRQAVEDLLETLTDDQREVILLRFLADLPIAEVATITGRPETAVKALQRRGLAALRRELSVESGIARTRATDSCD